MVDFIKLADAKAALKGSFIGTIIKSSDLKSGTSQGRDWTKKHFTVEDDSGSVDLVAWNEEKDMFEVGNTYEFHNPWWKTYEGKVSVQLGKYGQIKKTASCPEPPKPKDENQQQIDKPSVNCPHGTKKIENYMCLNCVKDLVQGIADELRTIKEKL